MGDPPNPPPPPPPRGSPGLGRLEGRETAVISKKGQNEFQQVLANNMRKMVCAGKGPGPCGDTSHASCPPPDPHQESPLALLAQQHKKKEEIGLAPFLFPFPCFSPPIPFPIPYPRSSIPFRRSPPFSFFFFSLFTPPPGLSGHFPPPPP
eukprot:Hpha_TRINITY_DN15706_c2_g4::TRINITY_DN15706_c2_g4_i1::g.37530::m.37530